MTAIDNTQKVREFVGLYIMQRNIVHNVFDNIKKGLIPQNPNLH